MAAEDRPALRPTKRALTDAGGRPLKVRGEVLLPLDLMDAKFLVDCVVADIDCDLLLGMPFLLESRANLNFATSTLELGEENYGRCGIES